ncbi:MAG TPA: alpha/beta hydrolase, partial [Candidatus Acidoferrales bacterium]|nr:alpha/beta hydrolase [Candidatus Acidoferrales bacterium]
QNGFTEETVDSPVGRQTCFTAGTGAPLVFLHGAGDHAGSWAGVAPQFTSAWRVIVVDGAGRGASAPYEGRITMEAILAGLDAVLVGQALACPILVGNSLGAWTAMVWAARNAARVSRIVAVNGGPVHGLRPDLTLTPANREEARRLWEAMLDTSRHAVADIVLDELIRKGRCGALSRISIEDLHPWLMDGRLDEIAVPVDLIWGESDQLVPLEYARGLQRGLPRARLTTIPGCGHIPHLEAPDRFVETLRAVLEQKP